MQTDLLYKFSCDKMRKVLKVLKQ